MADLVMVATLVAFVLLCVAYVGWCDRIIVQDEVAPDGALEGSTDSPAASDREQVAA